VPDLPPLWLDWNTDLKPYKSLVTIGYFPGNSLPFLCNGILLGTQGVYNFLIFVDNLSSLKQNGWWAWRQLAFLFLFLQLTAWCIGEKENLKSEKLSLSSINGDLYGLELFWLAFTLDGSVRSGQQAQQATCSVRFGWFSQVWPAGSAGNLQRPTTALAERNMSQHHALKNQHVVSAG